jgi:ribosome-binding ATPase YchF (GTP1/OBG family)
VGVIYSDFETNFTDAETIAYDDYFSTGGETERERESGRSRLYF